MARGLRASGRPAGRRTPSGVPRCLVAVAPSSDSSRPWPAGSRTAPVRSPLVRVAGLVVATALLGARPAAAERAAGGDTLQGTVRDTAGSPIVGAVVHVAELNLSVIARSDGSFR